MSLRAISRWISENFLDGKTKIVLFDTILSDMQFQQRVYVCVCVPLRLGFGVRASMRAVSIRYKAADRYWQIIRDKLHWPVFEE